MQAQAKRHVNQMLLLDPILDQLKTVVEYHGVTVVEVAGGHALNAGYRGDAPLAELLRDSFRPDILDDTTDWLRQHMPMLVADVQDDTPGAQWLRQRLLRRFGEFAGHIGSWMCVSLTVDDRPIGVLAVDHRERGHYTARDMDSVQAFVEQRAKDIEHAILYADAARQAGEARAVLTVQQAIVRRRDPDAILQKVAQEVLRLTDARRALVFLSHEGRFRLSSAAGTLAPWLPVGWDWQTPMESPLLGSALETGKPITFDSLEEQVQAGAAGLLSLGSRTLLIFPLRSEHQRLGAIVAADKQVGTFGPNDERKVGMLASSAVIGLENARSHLQALRLARMAERLRIAQSLHDTVAQMLFSIGLAIKRALSEPLPSESARQSLEVASRLSARSGEELRSAIFALSRPELRGGDSLIDLLREQVEEFQSDSGVAATFEVPAPVADLPHRVGEAIYRILRESLANVHKHAQATSVVVRLQCLPDSIVLTIRDDGVGLDGSRASHTAGHDLRFGVETMRQLAAQVKGTFTIASNDERGVTVEARLPNEVGGDV